MRLPDRVDQVIVGRMKADWERDGNAPRHASMNARMLTQLRNNRLQHGIDVNNFDRPVLRTRYGAIDLHRADYLEDGEIEFGYSEEPDGDDQD